MKNTKNSFKIIIFLVLFLSIGLAKDALAGTATVSWNANTEPDLAGYKIYYGTSSRTSSCPPGGYASSVNVGNVTSYTFSNLTNGATYYFSITAYDTSNNESCFSSEANKVIPAPDTTPPTISSVSASSVTYNSATITWTTNEASDSQIEYGASTSYGSQTALNTSMVTSHSVLLSGLSASTLYHYKVKSKDAAGNLATSSDYVFITTSAADTISPSTPINLSATVISSSQINLNWTASTDNVGVAGYRVYRCTGTACTPTTQIATPTTNSYQDTGLSPLTTYTYKVVAYDAAGNVSGQSSSASATTQAASSGQQVAYYKFENNATDSSGNSYNGTPTAITYTTGKVGNTAVFNGTSSYISIPLTLSSTSRTQRTWTGWFYAKSTNDGFIFSEDVSEYWRVFLGNYGGSFVFSTRDTSSDDYGSREIISTALLSINQWHHFAAVYDSVSSKKELWIDGVKIANTTSSLTAFTSTGPTSITIGNSQGDPVPFNGMVDEFRIYDKALTQTEILELYNVVAPDTIAPTISLTVPASGSTVSGTITVSANASDNVGVAGVQFKLDGANLGAEDTSSPYSVSWNTTSSTNGSHTLTAVARDSAGNSATSASVAVTVNNAVADTTAPSTPTNLTAAVISSSQINLNWTASTDPVVTGQAMSGVTGYRVYRCTGSSCTPTTQIATPTTTSYSDTGLSASTTYRYRVRAIDAAGNVSSYSSAASATTQAPADTTPPTISSVSASSVTYNSAAITWTTNEASDSQVEYGTSTSYGSQTTLNTSMVTSHSVLVSGLSASTLYHYKVKSRDAAGNLATSPDYTFTTSSTPNLSVSISASPSSGTAPLSGVDLTAVVGGNVTGNTNYTFYCNRSDTGMNITTPYDAKYDNQTATTRTATDLCNYTNPGSYTAKVIVERGSYQAEARTSITVSSPSVSTKFSLNDRVQATATVNVRQTPSTSGTLLGSQALGALGTVIGGPTYADSYWWWNIDFDNSPDGWSVEDYLAKYTPPQDTTPPVISNISSSNITTNSATITWTTNEASDSQVEYGVTAAYGNTTTLDTNLVSLHNQNLTNLLPNTFYHYRVSSKDSSNNQFISSDYTFSTLQSDVQLSLIVSLAAQPSSGTSSLENVSLTAAVSGTAEGNINYTFYCNRSDSGINNTTSYQVKYDNSLEATKTAQNICNYTQAGIYFAKVIVERGALVSQAQTEIIVAASGGGGGGGGGGGSDGSGTPSPTPTPTPTPNPTPTPTPTPSPSPTPVPVLTPITKPINQMTAAELRARILEIQSFILYLQQEFSKQSGGETIPLSISEIPADYKFSTNLKYGQTSIDVKYLQIFLKNQGTEIYPKGLVTGYFGFLTKEAVIKFQEKYAQEILSPWKLTKGTGIVGKTTIEKINQILGR